MAEALLENEVAGREIERSIGVPEPKTSQSSSIYRNRPLEPNPVWMLEQICAEQATLKERTQDILSHIDALKQETKSVRAEIAQKKLNLLHRRSDLKSAVNELSQRKAVAIEPMERGINRVQLRWDAMHLKTMESRVFLCREAAQLYGLQQRKRKKGGLGRDVYLIGGMPIADLRDLNSRDFLSSSCIVD